MVEGRVPAVRVSDQRAERGFGSTVRLAHPDKEHIALLRNPRRFDLLRRKDNLLDEGVAALFGLAGAEAELVGLSFQSEKFTSGEAVRWLDERGFKPLQFVPKLASDGG